MKAGELIAIVDSLKANEVSEEAKFSWLGDAEARVMCEIHKTAPKDIDLCISGDSELCVPAPYSAMYSMYVLAMICFFAGDYDAYVKANAQYEKSFADYAKYCIRIR